MPERTWTRRAAATTVALLVTCASFSGLAFGSVGGTASHTQAVTSGTWKAVASPATVNFPISALVAPPPQYLSVNNTGSLTLTGATYTLTRGGLIVGTATVDACVGGTWNESTNACTGGVVTSVVTSANTPQSVSASGTFPASAGGSVRMRVSLSAAIAAVSSVTLGVSVTRNTQVRSSTTTNS